MSGRSTTTELLTQLAEGGDDTAWTTIVGRFGPIIGAVGRRLGLSAEDADDLQQEVMVEYLKSVRRATYQHGPGRLRPFLIAVSRRRAIDILRRRGRTTGWRGDSAINQMPDAVSRIEDLFAEEVHRKAMADALTELTRSSRFGEQTLTAFRRVHMDGADPAEVARELGVEVQVIYNATHRCQRRLEEHATEIIAALEL